MYTQHTHHNIILYIYIRIERERDIIPAPVGARRSGTAGVRRWWWAAHLIRGSYFDK